MYYFYGISNNNAVDLYLTLKQLKPRTKMFLSGHSPPHEIDDAKVFVFDGVKTLKRFFPQMPPAKDSAYVVFVVDSYLNLKTIGKVTILDSKITSRLKTKFFKVTPDTLKDCVENPDGKATSRLRLKDFDVPEALLSGTPISSLSKIFTFLYTVKNKEMRAKYQHDILTWMVTPTVPIEVLKKKLSFRGSNKKVFNYLSSEEVENLRRLFKPGVDVSAEIKEKDISTFDYNYLRKHQQKISK